MSGDPHELPHAMRVINAAKRPERGERIRAVHGMTDRQRWHVLRWIAANEPDLFHLAMAETCSHWDEP